MAFSVEIGALDETISIYDRSINSLNENLGTLNRSLEALRNNSWKGEAKEEFMSVKYGDWEKGILEHVSRLEFLNQMLKEARCAMVELERKGENLSI